MSRGKAYTRKVRAQHIKRKKRIIHEVYRWLDEWYPYDGQYSKGKIHCSCPMCRAYWGKYVPTIREEGKLEAANAALKEALDTIFEGCEEDVE